MARQAQETNLIRSEGGGGGESRSAARVMDVLDLFFNERGGLTLTDVSTRLGVPKSTAHGILRTMRRRRYLTWDPPTKVYRIGLRVVALAQASPVLQTIRTRARPHLEGLSASLRETVMLGAYESDSVVCVDTVASPEPVRFTVELGERRPLHGTSLGKLYLASLDEEEARHLLETIGLEPLTEQTVTSVDELLAELRRIRRDGYAVNRAESIEGVHSYGAPIFVHGGLVAGMSVVGISARLAQKAGAIVPELLAAARELSAELSEV